MNCFSAQQSDKTLAQCLFAHAPFLSHACSPQYWHILSPMSPAHAATGPGALGAAAAAEADEAEGTETVASAEAAAAAGVCGGAGPGAAPAAGAGVHEAAAPAEPLGTANSLLRGCALNCTPTRPAWPGTTFRSGPGTTFGSGPGTGCST